MLEGIRAYLEEHTLLHMLRDAVDIFLVYYLIYRALLVMRGTRAMQDGVGLVIVFLIYVLARLLELTTVLSIMGAVISSMILIIVVVFQNVDFRGQPVLCRLCLAHGLTDTPIGLVRVLERFACV